MLLNATAFRALLTGQKPPRYTIVSDEKSESTRPWAIPRRVQSLLGLLAAGTILLLLLPLRNRISSRQRAEHQAQAEKHLIIASYTAQNVSWLSEIPTAWTIKRYLMDDPSPELPGLPVPLNQGREAMAYLTYIIDHYDALPDYMVFTHGHERSWHQMEPLQMKVRALNLTALDEEDYISLRCGMQMGCEKQPYIDTKHVNWSGEDLQKRSKEAWIRIREPVMHEVQDDWLSGMFYEKFWHMLLGAGPEYCPSLAQCQQVHFSNAIICDGDTDATVFEGDAWMDTKCVSAFDGLDKDAPAGPAIKEFHKELLHIYADIRGKAGERHKMQQDAYNAQQVQMT
ncbi:hypothetical protein LTS10_004768 [Elasticomyces elasticus]|nr:hypothetical protein LTS10_004768 [Elasticomyces elasticus]